MRWVFLALIAVMVSLDANAQSSLPFCNEADTHWSECRGERVEGREAYSGEWRDNRRHGRGKLILASGDTYVGDFRDGVYHGRGTWMMPDGRKYVGDWQDGQRHGQGSGAGPRDSAGPGEPRRRGRRRPGR